MWKMLNNGVCPPEVSKIAFKSIASGQTNQAAIDNTGRLYTWGSAGWCYTGQTPVPAGGGNYYPHPAIYTDSGKFDMRRPFQVGDKSDWVKVEISEYAMIIMNEDGYLYFLGDVNYGLGGIAEDTQYRWNSINHWYELGTNGDECIFPTLVNNQQWKDFSLGWYHTIAQKADGSMWIWGSDNYGNTYGDGRPEDFMSITPIQMTWVPGPVKLFCADYDVNAIVTTSNEVWIWGNYNAATYAVPTHIALTLPPGVNITKVACSSFGVVVLLSNGRVYCQGDEICFSLTELSLDFVADPDNHTFVDIDCFSGKAMGIDTNGNAWGWGSMIYFVWSPHPTIPDECDYQAGFDRPTLAMADTVGQYRWKMISLGGWTYVGVDDAGDLYTNGENAYSELGIGLTETEHDHACYPVKTLPLLLDNGTAEGVLAEATSGTAAIQNIIQSPKQMSEHNLCGHWHKEDGLAEPAKEDIPSCCWNFAVDIEGADIVLYALGITYPCPIISLKYNIATRVWYGPYWRMEKFYTRDWLAGANTHGAFDALLMYGGDDSGSIFQHAVTGHRVTVKSTYHPTGEVYQREFINLPEQDCEGKIAVYADTGKVMLLLERSAAIELWVSTDRGNSYYLGESWARGSSYRYSRIVREDAFFYVGIYYSEGSSTRIIRTYRSADGLTWETRATVETPVGAIAFNMWMDSGTIFLLCDNTLFYSTDGAVTFTSRTITTDTNFGVANGSLQYAVMFYPNSLEKTDNYTAVAPVWDELPTIVGIEYELTEFTTIRNSGDYIVYMRNNIFVADRIVVPVSQTLGTEWELVQSPLVYFKNDEEVYFGKDDPRWKFAPQANKIPLDPQYR
jgi:alpha-tubulin suppressor-like RCC1 family protein